MTAQQCQRCAREMTTGSLMNSLCDACRELRRQRGAQSVPERQDEIFAKAKRKGERIRQDERIARIKRGGPS